MARLLDTRTDESVYPTAAFGGNNPFQGVGDEVVQIIKQKQQRDQVRTLLGELMKTQPSPDGTVDPNASRLSGAMQGYVQNARPDDPYTQLLMKSLIERKFQSPENSLDIQTKQENLKKIKRENTTLEGMKPLSPDATPEEKQAFLDALTPEDQEIVKGLTDYTLDPTKATSLFKSNARAKSLAMAKMYDPKFDMKSFTAAQEYVKPNSKVGQNVTSLNTVVGHITYMKDAISNLKAGGQPLENAVILTARQLTGDPTITNYDVAKEVVDNEMQRALTSVGVTQQGMERAGGILPPRKFGGKQAEQYVKAMSHILQARLLALETGYRQQVHRDPGDLITYPETRKALEDLMGETAVKGSSLTPSAQSLVDRYRKNKGR